MSDKIMKTGVFKNAPGGLAIVGFAILLLAELATISVIYKDVVDFDCSATGLTGICLAVSELPLRALGVLGVLFVAILAKPSFFMGLWRARRGQIDRSWLMAHLGGLVLLLAPIAFLDNNISAGMFGVTLALWLLGAALASLGAVFSILNPKTTLDHFKSASPLLLFSLILGFLAPEIARISQFSWQWEFLRAATFDASRATLSLFWDNVVANPATHELGVGDFLVRVGEQCSGIEGFALITLFFVVYVSLFKDDLRIERVWILLPAGLILSWCANIARITALISIGELYSPAHAINGFHSHAGWFFFTILSLAIATLGHSIHWFRKVGADGVSVAQSRGGSELAFFDDPMTFQIFPFIVFMGATLLISTFFEDVALYYPIKFVALAAVLFLFRSQIAALQWRFSPIAIGVGILLAVLWIAASPIPSEPFSVGVLALPTWAFAAWACTRVLGTTLLVPIVEELFFREYLLQKFRGRQAWLTALGVAITSGLFAMMHSKWELALLAGVVFAFLVLRKGGRITDAILAHIVANAVIAGWAVATARWDVL